MNINSHRASTMSLLFIIGLVYPSLIRCSSVRGLIEKASMFEEQVRSGDVLPEAMVKLICVTKQLRFLVIGGRVAAVDNVLPEERYPYLLCNSDKIVGQGINLGEVAPCIKNLIGNNIYDAIIFDLYDNPSP